jgi:hypothetical protein
VHLGRPVIERRRDGHERRQAEGSYERALSQGRRHNNGTTTLMRVGDDSSVWTAFEQWLP